MKLCASAFVILFSAVQLADAAIITLPPSLAPGAQYRLAFLTSGFRDATSANINDYNTFVSTAANSVVPLNSLGTSWSAIASTASVDARTNTGTDTGVGVPIFDLHGNKVADNYADLWDGTIDSPIRFTELDQTLDAFVWTGSNSDGTAAAGFTLGISPSTAVHFGRSTGLGGVWMFNGNNPKTTNERIYGMSGILSAPAAVPEPSMIGLWFAASSVAACRFRWRKRATNGKATFAESADDNTTRVDNIQEAECNLASGLG